MIVTVLISVIGHMVIPGIHNYFHPLPIPQATQLVMVICCGDPN